MDATNQSADTPYRQGMTLTIYEHDATGEFVDRKNLDYHEEYRLFRSGNKEHAIMKFPCWPLSQVGHGSAHILEIKHLLKDHHNHDAQLALCSLSGQTTLSNVVAKIYDPLCYVYEQPSEDVYDNTIRRSDPTNGRARSDYRAEARAYNYLQQPKLQKISAGYVPLYYGSWITSVPSPRTTDPAHPQHRAVCLHLMEYLPGTTLLELTYNPEERLSDRRLNESDHPYQKHAYPDQWLAHATRQWLEAETRMHQTRISHNDLRPHNIMIVPSPKKAMESLVKEFHTRGDRTIAASSKKKETDDLIGGLPRPRIVVFDFGQSTMDGSAAPDLPRNPMEKYWVEPWVESGGEKLVPHWWDDDKVRREWLEREFGGDRAKEYQPVDKSIFE